MDHRHQHQRRRHQPLRTGGNRAQHHLGIAERRIETRQNFARENAKRITSPVFLPQAIGVGDRFGLDENGRQAGRALAESLHDWRIRIDTALMVRLHMRRSGWAEGQSMLLSLRDHQLNSGFGMIRLTFGMRITIFVMFFAFMGVIVTVPVVMFFIMRARMTILMPFIMAMIMTETMDVPHGLYRHENGAIPGRAGGLQFANDFIGDLGMGVAAGLGGAVHRLDLSTERQIDGSPEYGFAFQREHPALGKT